MKEIHTIAETIPATISTMTVLLVLNQSLNLQKILQEFTTPTIQTFLQDVTGDAKSIYTSSKRPFNNSLVFKCKDVPTDDNSILNKQAVKVFCNGNVHITGVKNINDALYLGDLFTTMIELIYGGNGVCSMFTFLRFEVQLVNLYFQLPLVSNDKVLDLTKVMHYLQQNTPFFACYNTERHAGVIVKAIDFTLLVFGSGNVIISSIKEPSQLKVVRDFIQEYILQLPLRLEVLVDKPLLITKRHNPNPSFDYNKYIVLK